MSINNRDYCPFNPVKKSKRSIQMETNCVVGTSLCKVALKIAYLGTEYQGIARQKDNRNTVEEHLFSALYKSKLIDDIDNCDYSRCARTDKGVNALGQVVSLQIRTKISQDGRIEYPIPRIINSHLPYDIHVSDCVLVPNEFNARFSCISRIYKYIFVKGKMNIDRMKLATQSFVGTHDFRHFCKRDTGSNVRYERTILESEISILDVFGNSSNDENQLYVFTVRGRGFLYHQIRCMMGILFAIGNGQTPPSIVTDMYDTRKHPTKPVYKMAPENSLILWDCIFDDIKFKESQEHLRRPNRSRNRLLEHLTRRFMTGITGLYMLSNIKGFENEPEMSTK
jgi:tRNA pseudouridine38/39 synthase